MFEHDWFAIPFVLLTCQVTCKLKHRNCLWTFPLFCTCHCDVSFVSCFHAFVFAFVCVFVFLSSILLQESGVFDDPQWDSYRCILRMYLEHIYFWLRRNLFFYVYQYSNIFISATTTECFDCTTSSKYPFLNEEFKSQKPYSYSNYFIFKTDKTYKQTQHQKLLIFRDLTWVCAYFPKILPFW